MKFTSSSTASASQGGGLSYNHRNIRNAGRRSAASWSACFIGGICLGATFTQLWSSSRVVSTTTSWLPSLEAPSNKHDPILESPTMTSSLPNGHRAASGINQPRLCPGVEKLFNTTEQRRHLEEVLWPQAHAYHNLGGNRIALTEFLDAALDDTYAKIGLLPFILDNDADPKTAQVFGNSTKQQIVSELRRRDKDNRGGYYQLHLPGRFAGPSAKDKSVEHRFISSVWEPISKRRFEIAMGPLLEPDSCRGFSVLKGPPRRRYEDKYICGWDDLVHHTSNNKNDELKGEEPLSITPVNQSSSSSCNIVSIGSNDQWGFESQIVSNTDCRVATFDCTITNPKRKPRTDQVQFFSQCISAESKFINNRAYATYMDLLETAGFTDSSGGGISYLKMDVEGYEFDVLTAILAQAAERGRRDLLPEQLQVEFHYTSKMYDLPWTLRMLETGELMAFFSMLFREGGYMAVHIDATPSIPSLREVLFLRIFC